MPAVSSVTWTPAGADQGYRPVNSVLKEEPALVLQYDGGKEEM